MSLKRITKEFNDAIARSPEGCSITQVDDDPFQWVGSIQGPLGSPYEGGTFLVHISFPGDYPFKPPRFHMITKIFHSNWTANGQHTFRELCDSWSPALSVLKVLSSWREYIGEPIKNLPCNLEAAELYEHRRVVHDEIARVWTRQYATEVSPSIRVTVKETRVLQSCHHLSCSRSRRGRVVQEMIVVVRAIADTLEMKMTTDAIWYDVFEQVRHALTTGRCGIPGVPRGPSRIIIDFLGEGMILFGARGEHLDLSKRLIIEVPGGDDLECVEPTQAHEGTSSGINQNPRLRTTIAEANAGSERVRRSRWWTRLCFFQQG